TVTMLDPDNERPSAPANLTANLNSSNGVDLSWDASSDNVAVTGYDIYRDNTLIDSVGPITSYTDSSPVAGDHTYTVKAVDAAGNRSDPSSPATATVPDKQKPTAPANLQAQAQGSSRVNLSWDASSDNVGVTGYEIYRDNTLIDTIGATTSYSDTSVTPNTYDYAVRAIDAATNRSDPSNTATVTVNAPDTEKPSTPANLHASSPSSFDVDLTWDASSDNVPVTGYEIYRDNTLIDTIGATTSYSDTSVTPNTY